jgi:hypothetical protein
MFVLESANAPEPVIAIEPAFVHRVELVEYSSVLHRGCMDAIRFDVCHKLKHLPHLIIGQGLNFFENTFRDAHDDGCTAASRRSLNVSLVMVLVPEPDTRASVGVYDLMARSACSWSCTRQAGALHDG